jgi:hypothetical protein
MTVASLGLTPTRRRRAKCAVWAVTAVVLLSSCSSEPPPATPTASAQGVTFTGPWAHEFAERYEESTSPFVRQLLRDGRLTDGELAEVTEKYRRCLQAAGITLDGQAADGGTQFSFPLSMSADDADREANKCGSTSGEDAVAGLYFDVRRNPAHQDESAIMAACLVKKKLVPAEYDASRYAADSASGAFPFAGRPEADARFQECVADPLGREEGKD